jgi:S-adenosyl-L-methionine hydrolase (adenosine-forming)
MNIVTLTTDFGWKDYYVGMLKGAILSQFAATHLVDISHEIANYDIRQAAYILKNAYQSFPAGTIHLISVHNFYAEEERRYLLASYKNHYFIAADNGVFSLIFGNNPVDFLYELHCTEAQTIAQIKTILVRAVAFLLQNRPLTEIGTQTKKFLQRISLQPIINKNQIRGSVQHIDNYDNIILNVDENLWERVGQNRPFELYFKRFDPITQLSANYADVAAGEVLCLFNAAGFLEIAIYMDKAASLLNLSVDDTIQIDFLD